MEVNAQRDTIANSCLSESNLLIEQVLERIIKAKLVETASILRHETLKLTIRHSLKGEQIKSNKKLSDFVTDIRFVYNFFTEEKNLVHQNSI